MQKDYTSNNRTSFIIRTRLIIRIISLYLINEFLFTSLLFPIFDSVSATLEFGAYCAQYASGHA